jgi:hypothetical protein
MAFLVFSHTVIDPTQLRLCMPTELLPIRSDTSNKVARKGSRLYRTQIPGKNFYLLAAPVHTRAFRT